MRRGAHLNSARLALTAMLLYNVSCAAVPLFTIGASVESAAATIFVFGGSIALAGLLSGFAFALVFFTRRQKWPGTWCTFLAITPFLACIAVAQAVAIGRPT